MRVILLLFCLCFSKLISAQELNLDVKVSAPKLNLVDPKVFKTLELTIDEFLNNNQWTEHEYEPHEKIEGSFTLNILDEITANDFVGEIRIQTLRPVYNSSYKTPLINIVDKSVAFSYSEFQPLENSTNSYIDNLSSILTYYVYTILAYDYDSFEALGGEQYFQKAQNVINVLPSSLSTGDDGWRILGLDRNRYWLIENALSPRIRPLRAAFYEYHIKSLDMMYDDLERSIAIMQSTLATLDEVEDSYPNTYYVQAFADTKRDEIVNIFKGANKGQQTRVHEIMVNVDPAQSSLYEEILKR